MEGTAEVPRIHSSSTVSPSEATPRHWIWLSNLDALRMYFAPLMWLYRPTNEPDFFSTEALKRSLSKVLIPFYPFAGELEYGDNGRIRLNCVGKGVPFVSASCDFTLEEFGDFNPRPAVARLFLCRLPAAEPPCPVSAFQVTRFRCGGVCLAAALHHMMSDGTAHLNFINAWAELARCGDLPSSRRPPFVDRSLLRPRSPPAFQFSHGEYDFYLTSADGSGVANTKPSVAVPVSTVTLGLSRSQVADLKGRCGGNLTTFSAVIAHAWRCACKARLLGPDQRTRLYANCNIRPRLRPPLPPEYLGNAILYMRAESRAGSTLADFGRVIENAKTRLTDEYLRSLIDFMEINAEALRRARPVLPPTDIVAVNWLNLPFYDLDFGWGKPCYVHRAEVDRGSIVVLRNLSGEKGAVLVTATLEQGCISEFSRIFYQDLGFARPRPSAYLASSAVPFAIDGGKSRPPAARGNL